MRRRLLVVITSCLVVAALAPPSAGADPATRARGGRYPAAVESRLRAALEFVQDRYVVPGLAVSVSTPGVGRFTAALGARSTDPHRPVNRATSFRVGSITKTFTATAVLQLVDDGRLALDATIEAWAPRLAYADRITVRDLLGMTSGIPDEGGPGSLLSELAGDDPTRVWAPEEVIDLAVLDEVLQGPTPPGSYEYSDANYALLGIIAESVTGQPIDELVRRRILRPLHLRHTSFPASGLDMPSPGATGYGIEFPEGAVSPATVVDASVYGAAGAMISTLGDMERWARALATGALLSPAMQQERLRLTEDIAEFPPLPGFGGQPVFGGYGLGILSVDGYLGHNGVVNGFMSELFHDPATGTSIVVLLNGETILTSGDDEELLPIADALFVTLADVVAGTP